MLSKNVEVFMGCDKGPRFASTMLFAERFGGDTRTAVKCMLLSSILCVVTIPLLLLLL